MYLLRIGFAWHLFLVVFELPGQTIIDFRRIDQWAINQKLSDTAIVEFTRQLIAPAENDFEKMRAIFVFVTRYLKYEDQSSRIETRRINQNITDILSRKQGICWDYAQLICHMAEIAALPCMSVVGFSQDLNSHREIGEEPDHAWNVVMLQNNYYLLDATWESNTLYADDYLKQEYKVDYFMTDPELFIKNHFPVLDFFQLLSCPLSFKDFIDQKTSPAAETPCSFEYGDSIRSYLSHTFLDRKIIEANAAYHIQPNTKNESAWGHAIMDKAIDLKEKGDEFFEQGNHTLAKKNYEEAFEYFSSAENKVALFPWQSEALAFCHLNYAQILYRINQQSGKNMNPVIDRLRQSKSILEKLNSRSFSIINALDQINYQISVLE